jgi:hypothetical protein
MTHFHNSDRIYERRDESPSKGAKNPFRTTLISPCVVDCAICMAFLRGKDRCGGCYAPDRKCNKNCIIFACEKIRDRCLHACAEFPCKGLRQLDERYRKSTV